MRKLILAGLMAAASIFSSNSFAYDVYPLSSITLPTARQVNNNDGSSSIQVSSTISQQDLIRLAMGGRMGVRLQNFREADLTLAVVPVSSCYVYSVVWNKQTQSIVGQLGILVTCGALIGSSIVSAPLGQDGTVRYISSTGYAYLTNNCANLGSYLLGLMDYKVQSSGPAISVSFTNITGSIPSTGLLITGGSIAASFSKKLNTNDASLQSQCEGGGGV